MCPGLSNTWVDRRVERVVFVLFWSFFPGLNGLSKDEKLWGRHSGNGLPWYFLLFFAALSLYHGFTKKRFSWEGIHCLFVKDGSNNLSTQIRKTDKWKARDFQALKISSTAWTWLGSPKLCFNVAAYYILFAPFLPSNKET